MSTQLYLMGGLVEGRLPESRDRAQTAHAERERKRARRARRAARRAR